MTTIKARANSPAPQVRSQTLRRNTNRLLIVLLLLGLGSLNVLTLLSDKVHTAGYSAIRAILATAVPDAVASRMLSNSSTVRRQKDVAVAARKLSDEMAMLVASSKALEAKQASLLKSLKEVEAANGALKRSSEIRATAVAKASKRLAFRSVTNATRNVSSVFVEAAPIVGTGIILAVTALDVHDACETLKDVNEMNSVFGHQQEDQTKVCGMKIPANMEVWDWINANTKAAYQSAADTLKRGVLKIYP